MSGRSADELKDFLSGVADALPRLEAIYKDIHSHPELSMHETRTAKLAAEHLRNLKYEVIDSLGGTGVVGILRNGSSPTVMLRADMDALSVREDSDVDYQSKVTVENAEEGTNTPVAHACGHDMHVTWLMAASEILADQRDKWSGTLLVVFQPGEETAQGAKAMIDDGLFDKVPKPDIVLGQHVMMGPAGRISISSGPVTSAADSFKIRLFGRGAHGSMPQASVDPVVMAASTVLRLQTIVSREVAASEAAVVTIGALQAGSKENVIPDEATIKLNIRTFDEGVRKRVIDSMKRIVRAEAQASGAPREPEFTVLDTYPLNVNEKQATARASHTMESYFGEERIVHTGPAPASEDFGCFGTYENVPSVYWFVGGTDPDVFATAKKEGTLNQLPVNHSPQFAPVLHPTLSTGVEAMTLAALSWLAKK